MTPVSMDRVETSVLETERRNLLKELAARRADHKHRSLFVIALLDRHAAELKRYATR